MDAGLPAPLDLAQKRSPAYFLCQGSGTGFSPARHCLSDTTASGAPQRPQPLRGWEVAYGHLGDCRGTVRPRPRAGCGRCVPCPRGTVAPPSAPGTPTSFVASSSQGNPCWLRQQGFPQPSHQAGILNRRPSSPWSCKVKTTSLLLTEVAEESKASGRSLSRTEITGWSP